MSEIKKRKGIVDLDDIIKQAVESVKFVNSWNKDHKNEYVPSSGFSWSENDADKPDRFRFKRIATGHTPSAKSKQYKRILTHIQKRLRKTDKRVATENNKQLKLTTVHSYEGKIKEAINKRVGAVGLNFIKDINLLITEYPEYQQQLERIKKADATVIEIIRVDVRNEIHQDRTALSKSLFNALNKLETENEVVRGLGLDSDDSKARKDAIATNRATRKTNAITVSLSSVKRIMKQCLVSDDFYELALGVALATGRRAIEVIHTGEFSKTRGKNNIKFMGQAKTSILLKETPNIIPLLVDSGVVLEAVTQLRKHSVYGKLSRVIKGMNESEQNIVINRRVAAYLNALIRDYFDNDNMVFHTSRVIAVKIAVDVIYPQSKNRKMDNGEFMAKYTGHTLNGKSSYSDNASYEHVHISIEGADNIPAYAPESTSNGKNVKRDAGMMQGLLKALEADRLSTSKPFLTWYGKVMEKISKYPFRLTQSSVSKGYQHEGEVLRVGGGRNAVRRYFNHPIIKEYIDQYNTGV